MIELWIYLFEENILDLYVGSRSLSQNRKPTAKPLDLASFSPSYAYIRLKLVKKLTQTSYFSLRLLFWDKLLGQRK